MLSVNCQETKIRSHSLQHLSKATIAVAVTAAGSESDVALSDTQSLTSNAEKSESPDTESLQRIGPLAESTKEGNDIKVDPNSELLQRADKKTQNTKRRTAEKKRKMSEIASETSTQYATIPLRRDKVWLHA